MTKAALFLAIIFLFSGCGRSPQSEVPSSPAETSVVSANTTQNTAVIEDPSIAAEAAYMDFLRGQLPVQAAEHFKADDAEYNQDGLLYSSYSLNELKTFVSEYEMTESVVKYTFFDFGADGIRELVLKFESTDPAFMNWTGIIHYNGTGLDLNYCYEDGYRTFSVLYDGGYLQKGGSSGAGAHGYTIVHFDANGFGTELYSQNEYYGSFAESIEYDLSGTANWDDAHAIPYESGILVYEYIKDGSVKISVAEGWSEDPPIRYEEEDYINYLVALGAEQISFQEMTQLSDLSKFGSEVTIETLLQ